MVECRGQLAKAFRDLMSRWIQVRGTWDDARAQYFEQHYLLPLEIEVRKAVAAMDQMNVVLQKITKDCE